MVPDDAYYLHLHHLLMNKSFYERMSNSVTPQIKEYCNWDDREARAHVVVVKGISMNKVMLR